MLIDLYPRKVQDLVLLNYYFEEKLGDQLNWAGPFRVVSKMSEVNYVIQEEGKEGRKVVHVNMIKPYYRKENFV